MEENTQQNSKESSPKPTEKIIPKLIEDEMKQSYIDYAMSVIVSRALPDVRDGLKPVHRRVLYTMWETGLLHNKPFKKSANVVGNCMARYHPHGDAAIYDTLVRLTQDFSLRHPLIQGQGNFGSIDGDSAAAMRYTEARLNKLSEEMLQDIDKDTVKFVPNFDDSSKEPSVLPSKVPNLLINGTSGIAVGMATNMPPHNMGEVIDAVIKQIDNPKITIEQLMESIKGPDFPTGGIICGRNEIINMYKTGRGKLRVRAKADLEEKKDKKKIIISAIPYMVNKSELISQIADLVRDKKIIGISDLRDESDRDGMRIVVELKKDANHEVILNLLFKHSRLQTTFGVIMLALVNNEPKILNLKQIIQYYVDHRKEIIKRRTEFELNKAKKRAHILEGIIVALNNIDPIVKLIKESKSVEQAKTSLTSSFTLSVEQAQAILEMRLQRLTSLEQEKVKNEHKELLKLIEKLKSILASNQKILDIIKKEILELKEKYANERRTQITEEVTELDMEDLIKDEKMVITVTHSGYIKRQPLTTYKQQRRGGHGMIATGVKEEDFVESLFVANTHSHILFFTNKGKIYWLKVYNIPEGGRQTMGKAIINLLSLSNEEKITAFVPVKQFDDQHYLIMATKKGTIKKTNLSAYGKPRRGGIIAITLDDNDELVNVSKTDGNREIMLATKNGLAIRFEEEDVRPTGRSSRGVRGATLKENDDIIGMVIARPGKTLLTITQNGYGKRTQIEEYRLINRGGKGVINILCTERNGSVSAIKSIADDDELMFISQKGIIIRTPAKDISVIGRSTQGVRLMKLGEGDKIVAAAKIIKEDNGNIEENGNGNNHKEDSDEDNDDVKSNEDNNEPKEIIKEDSNVPEPIKEESNDEKVNENNDTPKEATKETINTEEILKEDSDKGIVKENDNNQENKTDETNKEEIKTEEKIAEKIEEINNEPKEIVRDDINTNDNPKEDLNKETSKETT
jgi:DNA gyrase subunit A